MDLLEYSEAFISKLISQRNSFWKVEAKKMTSEMEKLKEENEKLKQTIEEMKLVEFFLFLCIY